MTSGSEAGLHHILILCEGNHCRGPLAEALLRPQLPPGLSVSSAGLAALVGQPADPEALRLAQAEGLDLSALRGRQATPDLLLKADLILVMESAQRTWCGQLAPSALGRVFLLGHWRPPDQQEIPDPYRRGPEAFRLAFERIRQSVSDWLPHLAHEQRSA